MSVKYTSAVSSRPDPEVYTSKGVTATQGTGPRIAINFKVTTPLFYSAIARELDVAQYLARMLQYPDPLKATCYVSHVVEFLELFRSTPANSFGPSPTDPMLLRKCIPWAF